MKKKAEEIEEAIPLDIKPLNPIETTDYFRIQAKFDCTSI